MPSTPQPLEDILASRPSKDTYVHVTDADAVEVSAARPGMPAGILGLSVASNGIENLADHASAFAVEPSRSSRYRTLDSDAYAQLRFNEDFVRLYATYGHDAHKALAKGADGERDSPFLSICGLTRRIAEGFSKGESPEHQESTRRTWSNILVSLGYDVVLDRGQGLLSDDGPAALFLSERSLQVVGAIDMQHVASERLSGPR